MASYPVSLDAGINTELTSSRGPRIPGFKASSLYPPEAKERAFTWSRLFFPYFKSFLPSSIGDPDPCFFADRSKTVGCLSCVYHMPSEKAFCSTIF
jgi:hypothetical protein